MMAVILKLLGPAGIAGVVVGLALSILLGVQVHKTHVAQHTATHWQQAYTSEQSALVGTIANYRAAATQAAQEDQANVARVAAEQRAINQRTSNEYEARLSDARARAGRLRAQLAAAAHPGSSAAAGVSGSDATPGSSHGSAAEDGFSVSDRLIATEQAIQLDELIKWLQKNLKVDLTGHRTQADVDAHPFPQSAPTGSR